MGTYLLLLSFILAFIHSKTSTPPEYASYEIVVPRRLAMQTGKAKKGELAYAIRAAGKDYVVRLKPKTNLVSKNFLVFTYDTEERRVKIRPNISTECYHEGYVEGVADSLAALSTCFGLKGFLKIRDISYGIKPLQDSPVLQHALYVTEDMGLFPLENRNASEESNGQAEKARRKKPRSISPKVQIHPVYPKYVELYVVVDSTMLFYKKDEHQKVVNLVIDIVNIVDAHFHLLNTQIILMGMEIWNQGNLINDSSELLVLLNNFNAWRLDALARLTKHDTAHLFIHKNFSLAYGEANLGAICTPTLSAGVEAYRDPNPLRFAKVFAHEMGRHIGLPDDGPDCFCGPYRGCIMSSYHAGVGQFSNCSFQRFLELSLEGNLACLSNVPPNISVVKRCGNGVLDIGEQCDCGGPDRCKEDSCCTIECTFKPGAVCSSGPCCQNCQFLSEAQICRPQIDECDLPEYCTGKSEWCRPDIYVQDGTPCKTWTAFCYARRCWNHSFLCTRIFGKRTDVGHNNCFMKLNTAGSIIGNCGSNHAEKKYTKCQPQDAMCGRVYCAGTQIVHSDMKYIKVVQIPLGEIRCWATEYHGEIDQYDVGVVPDGISCGPKNICLDRKCQPTSVLKSRCDPQTKCRGRGVCNSRHNCHCNMGWAPPDCQVWGMGGSLDGGFPQMSYSTRLIRETFATVIPIAIIMIAAVTWATPRLCAMMPGWSHVTEWWNRNYRQASAPRGSVGQPRWGV